MKAGRSIFSTILIAPFAYSIAAWAGCAPPNINFTGPQAQLSNAGITAVADSGNGWMLQIDNSGRQGSKHSLYYDKSGQPCMRTDFYDSQPPDIECGAQLKKTFGPDGVTEIGKDVKNPDSSKNYNAFVGMKDNCSGTGKPCLVVYPEIKNGDGTLLPDKANPVEWIQDRNGNLSLQCRSSVLGNKPVGHLLMESSNATPIGNAPSTPINCNPSITCQGDGQLNRIGGNLSAVVQEANPTEVVTDQIGTGLSHPTLSAGGDATQ